MNLLDVESIVLMHDNRATIKDVSFDVRQGALACLLGPSGCGKTTVLRAIAGFHPLHRGEIRIRGRTVAAPGFAVAPEQRKVGMVFQDSALFPHLTVRDNVGFGLKGVALERRKRQVRQLLERVDLVDVAGRYPHELSGGQQQRVALARALAPQPDLILMDEPFSNLDVETRERLGHEVRDLFKEQGTTCVLVTHDQSDAFSLCDWVGVLHEGRLLQWDTPYNLYHEPTNRFVADFIGDGVFLPGTFVAAGTVDTSIGRIIGERATAGAPGEVMDVLIRPDDVVPTDSGGFVATVVRKVFKGADVLYTLRTRDGSHILSLFPSDADHDPGDTVNVRLQATHLVAFPR
jgi:iron(III) transport system ATP-binding protein